MNLWEGFGDTDLMTAAVKGDLRAGCLSQLHSGRRECCAFCSFTFEKMQSTQHGMGALGRVNSSASSQGGKPQLRGWEQKFYRPHILECSCFPLSTRDLAFICILLGLLVASKGVHFHIASVLAAFIYANIVLCIQYQYFLCLVIVSKFVRECSFEFGLLKGDSMLTVFCGSSLLFIK